MKTAMATMCLLAANAFAGSAFPKDFTADVTIAGGKTPGAAGGKIAASGNRLRVDMSQDGKSMAMLLDVNDNKMWLMMPEQKMAMEMPVNQAGDQPIAQMLPDASGNPCRARSDAKCKKLGSEKVNGRDTDKWEVQQTGKPTMNIWVDKSLRFGVKSTAEDGRSFELKNIKEGGIAASHFEVPKDFQVHGGMGEMGGPPPGGMQPPPPAPPADKPAAPAPAPTKKK